MLKCKIIDPPFVSEKLTYPCVRRHRRAQELVVLFTDSTTGIILSSDRDLAYKCGDQCDSFNSAANTGFWVPCTVELS